MKWLLRIPLLFLVLPAFGQFDTSSWDVSSVIGYDSAANQMIIATADPVSNGTAMRVYYMMEGFIGALAEEHVMDKEGDCYIGHRTVIAGRSVMRYDRRACHQYDVYRQKWREAVKRVLKTAQKVPLEKKIQ